MLVESASFCAQADEQPTKDTLELFGNSEENVTRKSRNIYNDQTFVSKLPHFHKRRPYHCRQLSKPHNRPRMRHINQAQIGGEAPCVDQ